MKEKVVELYENKNSDVLISLYKDYSLFKESRGKKGFLYSIYDPEDYLIYSWVSFNDVEKAKNIKTTAIYNAFVKVVDDDIAWGGEGPLINQNNLDDEEENTKSQSNNKNTGYGSYYDDDDDDYLDDYYGYLFPSYNKGKSSGKGYSSPYPYYSSNYYKPAPKKKGFFDEYTKSNTLVFHKTDPSTTMLSQVYDGKGWDVLHSCYDLDEEELFRVVDAHERIVCLGHGTPYGLMGMFGPEMAPHIKGKKVFTIWCNADAYFLEHKIGEGQFVTGNMPSEVWECKAAGCGKISKELMLENITYWSKLCADVCERCLNGDVKGSVDYVRKNYLEKYGNHPVTIYNCERTQCLGSPQPFPAYEFKGEPLKEKDFPVPNFDEEAFLKNPTPDADECPKKAVTPVNVPTTVEEPENKPEEPEKEDLFAIETNVSKDN